MKKMEMKVDRKIIKKLQARVDKFVTPITCGLYYKTITIIIMTIVVMLQIVASLTIVIDDTG